MCGLLGVFSNQKLNHRKKFQTSLNLLNHRGPDAQGTHYDKNIYFGHKRLAIVDLSKNALQPMHSKENDYVIIYNGELYNYQIIKKKLVKKGYKFFSNSDTEVVLNSIIEWGENIIKEFDGMFAFAIWNKKKNNLIIARDRYGIKPLYYSFTKKFFIFSSEIKSIKKYLNVEQKLDKFAINEYFAFQNIISNRTFYENIKLFPSGNFLVLDKKDIGNNNYNFTEYWDFNFLQKKKNLNEGNTRLKIKSILEKSIKSQIIGNVKIGSYLSSGVDSSSICFLAKDKIKKFTTFTCGSSLKMVENKDKVFDETNNVEKIAKFLKLNNCHYQIQAKNIFESLRKIVFFLEDPRVGQSYPNFYASRLVKKNGYKVVFSGTGADEIFGGYPWRYFFIKKKMKYSEFKNKYFLKLFKLFQTKKYFDIVMKKKFKIKKNYLKKCVYAILDKQFGTSKKFILPDEALSLSLYFEAKTFLKGLLIVEDKLSMANSIETRLPYLNNELVDFVSKIPNKYRFSYNDNEKQIVGKKILRNIVRRFLPKNILLKKQGFSTPDSSWFKKQLKNKLKKYYLNKNNFLFKILNYDLIVKKFNEHFAGKNNFRLLIWSVIYSETFLRKNEIKIK